MTKDTERAQVGCYVWFLWAMAWTVASTVALFVALVAIPQGVHGIILARVGMVGATVGIAQWFVLRWHVSRAGWWVLASAVGGALTFAVIFAADGIIVARVGMVGAAVGIAQWFVLRGQVFRAGWWVLASAAGFAVGGAVIRAASEFESSLRGFSYLPHPVYVAGFVLGLALYGAITGVVMVWLLRQPVIKEPSSPKEAT